MAVSAGFLEYIMEQLGRVTRHVRSRRMFGGVGLYAGELFFALVDNDELYLKVDDTNRPDFEALGIGPFRPFGPDGEAMQYYPVPGEMLEETDTLSIWVARAIDVARRKKQKKPTKSR
jgi:DNA transformation protein and related proteins